MTSNERASLQEASSRRQLRLLGAVAAAGLLAGGLMVMGYVSEGSLIVTALIGAVGVNAATSYRGQ